MKIYLTEEQAKYIQENAKLSNAVSSEVIDALEDMEGNLIGDIEFNKELLTKGYQESVNNFKDDISKVSKVDIANALNKTLNKIIKIEGMHKEELETLCYNTIVTLFNIPEDCISYRCELSERIDPSYKFHISSTKKDDYEYDDVESKKNESKEIFKRMMIDELIVGASYNIMEQALDTITSELFNLDEELPHLYSRFLKLNNYLQYISNIDITDNNHHQGGYVEVNLGGEEELSVIKVKAMTFPILLSESIKGLLELVSSKGLPDDINVAKRVVEKADILSNEPWYMRLGSVLWKKIIGENEMEDSTVPYLFDMLVDVDADSFIAFMEEISNSTKKAKDIMSSLIMKAEYQNKYTSFEDDLMQKQQQSLIIDDFTAEELDDELLIDEEDY